MSSPFRSNKFQILLFSLACTFIIFNLYKNPNLSSYSFHKFSLNLRNLITIDKVEKRCKNTPKKFLEKYKTSDYPDSQNVSLDRYQTVLKEMIEKKNIKKINKYLPRIIIFFVITIVDIIFIFLWISFCACCCCCCKKQKISATGCSKCYFFLFFLLSIIAMLVCVFGYIKTPSVVKSFNSTICSLYKLVFHFTDGTGEDFPNNNWKGFGGLESLIKQYNTTKNSNKDLQDCTGTDEICQKYRELKNSLENINNNNNNFMNNLGNSKDKIYSLSKVFDDVKNKKLDDVEKIMEKFDKCGKLGLFLLFSAIFAFCFICLLILSSYFICNCNCMGCLYHIFWNIEMLIIIVTMLIGVCLGITGVISKDLIAILKYTKSDENLKAEKPFLLDFDNTQADVLTICLNGNGNLKSFAFNYSQNQYESNIQEQLGNFNDLYKNVNNDDSNKPLYDTMHKIIINMTELENDLKGTDKIDKIFDCKFFQWDFEILTKELKDSIASNITLYSLVIIAADLIAFISLFFGLTIVNNYKGSSVEKQSQDRNIQIHVKGYRPNMDSSSDNLRK